MNNPIDAIHDDFFVALAAGPTVITATTGAGKSTQIPRWCQKNGRVLVVEPRRVACRGLAMRVAELQGTRLADKVGYAVRNDSRMGPSCQIVFVTTGVALKM
ncbi:MAG: ATP-dependent RNA helicase, partial [Proteobacteria bacterium]|nr:ATP-dependent RNA helicase [Pseudomonadota bacterium]